MTANYNRYLDGGTTEAAPVGTDPPRLSQPAARVLHKRGVWIAAVAAIVAAVVGGIWYHHCQRYKHLAVHEAGMMYRSAWLEPEPLAEVIEKYQVRTVVNLCRPGEMGEERWVKQRADVKNAGAKLVELPMPTSVDPADPLIGKHIDVLSDPDNYPMLVHCQHGVTRTAKELAIYDIVIRNMSGAESLAAQPLFGRDDHNVHVRAFVRNFEKRRRELYPLASADRLKSLWK